MSDDAAQGNGPPPDTLSERIGVLTRREVEARILAPIIEALGKQFGRDEVLEIVKNTIVEIAQQQGSELSAKIGGNGSREFMESLKFWTVDDALAIDVQNHDHQNLDFNVTRCRYAELYQALGIPELGAIFSCNRDYALVGGFNEEATLERKQTIMGGASHCDFRFRFPTKDDDTMNRERKNN